MTSEAEAVGALLLGIAQGSQGGYVLVRQGQRARSAPGVREWRVSIRVLEASGPRERSFAGAALVDALARALEGLRTTRREGAD